MHERVVAGTDVAMIGAWDAEEEPSAVPRDNRGWTLDALEQEAMAGHLFLVHTGGDGEWVVDVYVDEDLPEGALRATRALPGAFLLSVPSGRLTVGGVEHYGEKRLTTEDRSVAIPPGSYRVRCHASNEDEDQPEPSLPDVIRDTLDPEGLAYYRLKQRARKKVALLAIPPLLLFPALAVPFGWKLALAATAVVAWPYGKLLERWSRRRIDEDPRWRALNQMVDRAWRAARSPTLILELRGLADPAGLTGGSVEL